MQLSFASRLSLLVGSAVALPTLFACLNHPLKPVEYEAAQEKQDSIALTVNKDVDILFVIDNSGSMGEEQGTLAANFDAFIEVLEEEKVKANYRIGVTTTDNGNPWCSGTTPEGGALRLSSCRSRASEFVFDGAQMIDAYDEACASVCKFDNIEITATEVEGDNEEKARPWLESIEGRTNLGDGTCADGAMDCDGSRTPTTVEAFQCFGPQGINGCGFESQLESMYKALKRSETDGEDSFNFLRANAILSVVHVTDEADCSYETAQETIFLPDGERTFWSLPDEGAPTSAVCWNAGVACDGEGPSYSDCQSVNFAPDGSETDDDNAVLRPVSRYVDFLQNFEDNKQMITPNQEVLVALIGGVGSDGIATYQDSLDQVFQDDFGIGPGCTSDAGEAVPPVRLREFAEAFAVNDEQNMFSICEPNYAVALEAIAEAIADQVKPACMPACVADTDPTSVDILDPSCTLLQEAPTNDGDIVTTTVPQCDVNNDNDFPGEDINVCYIALFDGKRNANNDRDFATEGEGDDMSETCADEGWNLEFVLKRREGFPAPGGTSVKATCELSQSKVIDCPQLP